MLQRTPRVVQVQLPELHPGQVKLIEAQTRFTVARCGRRWGKTVLGATRASDGAMRGQTIGWFAPEYKFIADAQREIERILLPVKRSYSKDGAFLTTTGGRIDYWSLENENAGRSRGYHGIVVDEAAFTKDTMLDIWRKNLRPTLLDYRGWALVLSNTNGVDPQNFLYQLCHEPKHGFNEFHAPTSSNPRMDAEELAQLKLDSHPQVYLQEYEAEFVDWSGTAFFARPSLLVNDLPVPVPARCDAVFAVIDTAAKTGKDNDGTGVVYFAIDARSGKKWKLTILDYDIRQIEGALLEKWLPTVLSNLEALAKQCGARAGSLGAWVEDKSTGTVLIQQAARRELKVRPVDSKLTAMGKDERAISVSGYVYRGEVKMAVTAFDRLCVYKERSGNHLLLQVTGFRPGDKDANKRADDLLDCFTYGVAIGLGDAQGW